MEEKNNDVMPKKRESKFSMYLGRVLAGLIVGCMAAVILAATIRVVMWIL